MGKAIGIDLGTTNTAVAVLVNGRPVVLEDEKGYKVLPSAVSLKDDGKFVVGQAARNMVLTSPDRTVYAIKRIMGRRFDSPEVEAVRRRLPYGIEPAPDGTCLVTLGGVQFSPVEVSAVILQVARGIAERALGEKVEEAVITVPAYFNHAQRAATLEAARVAGLRCDRLLNEPTAAALAYGYRKEVDKTILIYDLGGGTFDVSVLRLAGGIYEILATRGDTFLGGEDFDHRVLDHLANHFEAQHKIDLREDRVSLQRLKDASERAKCELSFTDRTTVLIPRVAAERNLELVITRLTLESVVEDLVQRTLDIVRKAVGEAGLRLAEIEEVILVGGQTRMPRVREAVSALFQKEPSRNVHPEEAVAIGAAVHAASLSEPGMGAPVLLDVTPFDLGIDVAGGLFQAVIGKNSQVPSAASRLFATVHDNQEAVKVTVRQGFSRLASENEFLGEFVLNGLSPAPRMQTKVEVTFRLDSNGMLHVIAVEPSTGERKRITVRNYAEAVVSKGEKAPILDGDIAGRADTAIASAPVGGAEGPAPVARPAGRLSGLFGRIAGRVKRGKDSRPAAAAEVGPAATPEAPSRSPEEPSELPDADLEALPAEADRPPQVSFDAMALTPIDEDAREDTTPVPLAGPASILLPAPPAPGEYEDPSVIKSRGTGYASRQDAMEASVVAGVAAFGLAGESPRWERPGRHDTNITAGPITRGPTLVGGPLDPAGDGAWDFGLDLGPADKDLSEEDFDRLFTAAESLGDASVVPPALTANPTLSPQSAVGRAPGASGSGGSSAAGPNTVPLASRPDSGPRTAPLPGHPLSETPSVISLKPRAPAAPFPAPTDRLPSDDDGFPDPSDVADLFALAEDLLSLPDQKIAASPGQAAPPAASAPSAARAATPPPRPLLKTPPGHRTLPPGPDATSKRRARLKLAYPRLETLVAEHRDNLRRAGCFVRTDKPLPVGREVRIEVSAPNMDSPLELYGVVAGRTEPAEGRPGGMTVTYQLTPGQRVALEALIQRVGSAG